MRICRRAVAVAFICFLTGSGPLVADEIERHEPDIDMFASMAGSCSTLKVAERDFTCKTLAFFHSPGGRSSFTVPLNDPDDDSHIITFSGEKSKRERDNLYELSVDQMLFKSKDRPKVDGLPVPSVVLSTGTCKQIGNFAAQQVSSITCDATDANGNRYQLQFEFGRLTHQGSLDQRIQSDHQRIQLCCECGSGQGTGRTYRTVEMPANGGC